MVDDVGDLAAVHNVFATGQPDCRDGVVRYGGSRLVWFDAMMRAGNQIKLRDGDEDRLTDHPVGA